LKIPIEKVEKKKKEISDLKNDQKGSLLYKGDDVQENELYLVNFGMDS